jgi:hypothetical protein
MARCPHNRVQQFTECCLDCGRNVYESDEDYYKYLMERKGNTLSNRIEQLEKELGISHPGNRKEEKRSKCDNPGSYYCSCGGECQTW